jgi:acetate kinase
MNDAASLPRVLTVNAGSSSLKAAVYAIGTTEVLLASAQIDRIGRPDSHLRLINAAGQPTADENPGSVSHTGALQLILERLRPDPDLQPVALAVHRVVHGGDFTEPQRITPEVVNELGQFAALDPDHAPQTLAAIDTVARMHPDLPQVACFDTAFHLSLPPVARMYPLPSRLREAGVRRYGFHGLSCEYVVSALRSTDPDAADGRLIVAHLGSGASLTAVHHGQSVDTTMGFSPAGGLMMGTRTGDLDPGVLLYAIREQGTTAADLTRLVNAESGLLGVSGTSADMRDLLAREATDPRAAAAVGLFCYLARKSLGALFAVLGGLDTLVFTGGIGEHSPVVRERILKGLDGLGLSLDPERNAADAPIISAKASGIVVRVMATNEDLILARHARRFLIR